MSAETERENWTEPRHAVTVAKTLAGLKGIEIKQAERAATANMRQILGKGWDVIRKYADVGDGVDGGVRDGI